MSGRPTPSVGDRIPEVVRTLDQTDLVRYAGASGDLNPLHYLESFAAEVSPTGGVIAHGMLNMGIVSAVVCDWAGGSARLRELSASFRAPCPVGAEITIAGEVIEVDAAAGTATLSVSVVTADGAKVVDPRRSRAVVSIA